MILLATFLVAFILNIICFIAAFNFKTDKLTDAAYALSFLVIAVVGLDGGRDYSSLILLAMVAVWALRLGGFLLMRTYKKGGDRRFDGVRDNFWKFAGFWVAQAISAWIIMLPAIVFLSGHSGPFDVISVVGVLIWAVGLAIETLADWQKYRFRANPANHGKWIDQGLWHRSRHPNYLGEILVWVGVYVFTLPFFGPALAAAMLVSPVWITILLVFVSGVPKLEKSADARWGGNADYRTYKRSVPLLTPRFWQS